MKQIYDGLNFLASSDKCGLRAWLGLAVASTFLGQGWPGLRMPAHIRASHHPRRRLAKDQSLVQHVTRCPGLWGPP